MFGRRVVPVALALLLAPACVASIDVHAQLGTDGDLTTTTTASSGDFVSLDVGGPVGGQCEPTQWDSCPPGEKCTAWANDGGGAWNENICVPVDPNPVQLGDACTVEGNGVSGLDNCDVGSMCWDVDPETNQGTCISFCDVNLQCPNPDSICTVVNNGVLPLCFPTCNPLDPSTCATGDVCVPNPGGDTFVCVLDASGPAGGVGEPCEYVNGCDPGLLCAAVDSVPNCGGATGCCTEFCDLNVANCTQAGVECSPYYEVGMAPPGLEDVGVCLVP